MDRIAEAFVWPVRDPKWPSKVMIMALTLLIPIAGTINGLGWMLATLDRLRAGEERLPPAGLRYLGRGIRLFVVQIVYVLGIAAITAVFYVPALLVFVREGRGTANLALVSVGLLLNLLSFSITTLGSVALTFVMPAIVLATDRNGIAGGLRIVEVLRRARASMVNTLIAGLMLIAANFIGSLGLVACGIGVVFTAAYALATQAWIIRSFELGAGPTAGA